MLSIGDKVKIVETEYFREAAQVGETGTVELAHPNAPNFPVLYSVKLSDGVALNFWEFEVEKLEEVDEQ